jgi:hypothetical protein
MSRRGGPRSQISAAASLARGRFTRSDIWPSGHASRYMPGQRSSGMTQTMGVRALPYCNAHCGFLGERLFRPCLPALLKSNPASPLFSLQRLGPAPFRASITFTPSYFVGPML